jgi:hypothetical protein
MDILGKALALDSRLQTLETAVRERKPDNKPWWRDSKTVTIIGVLIAAVLPLLKFIDESFRSSREYRRQIVEQQEKIRQTYLDRVLKPGVTIYEQQKIFGLLAGLSLDPEMQKWAQTQLKETTDSIKASTKERDVAIEQKRELCLHAFAANTSPAERDLDMTKVKALEDKIADLDLKLSMPSRIGGCSVR